MEPITTHRQPIDRLQGIEAKNRQFGPFTLDSCVDLPVTDTPQAIAEWIGSFPLGVNAGRVKKDTLGLYEANSYAITSSKPAKLTGFCLSYEPQEGLTGQSAVLDKQRFILLHFDTSDKNPYGYNMGLLYPDISDAEAEIKVLGGWAEKYNETRTKVAPDLPPLIYPNALQRTMSKFPYKFIQQFTSGKMPIDYQERAMSLMKKRVGELQAQLIRSTRDTNTNLQSDSDSIVRTLYDAVAHLYSDTMQGFIEVDPPFHDASGALVFPPSFPMSNFQPGLYKSGDEEGVRPMDRVIGGMSKPAGCRITWDQLKPGTKMHEAIFGKK